MTPSYQELLAERDALRAQRDKAESGLASAHEMLGKYHAQSVALIEARLVLTACQPHLGTLIIGAKRDSPEQRALLDLLASVNAVLAAGGHDHAHDRH